MKYDKIVAINKKKSKEKAEIAIKEIEKMFLRKECISVTTLAKNTGFAKSFFYRNPEVRKVLDEALLQQGECYNPKKVIFDRALEETNNNLKSAVIRLKKRIVELEKDLFLSPWNEEDFIHELKENPMAGYYILEKENQIIGYIGLWFLGDQCQITTIATDRHFQGQGYASQLMEYALEKSEELHYQNVNLEVRVSNVKAIALYQKFGFKNVAVRKRYYSNGEDAYLMIKELEG